METMSDRDGGAEEHERSLPDVGRTPLTRLIARVGTSSADDAVLDAAMHRLARETAEDPDVYAGFGNVP